MSTHRSGRLAASWTATGAVGTGPGAWCAHPLWVTAGAGLGFAVSAVLAGLLELPRDWFLAVYLAVTVPFLFAYVRWSGVRPGVLVRQHLLWGLTGAVLVGGVMVLTVQRMDASPRAGGGALLWDLLWLGLVYGALDAALLTVLPVLATWRASTLLDGTATWVGKVGTSGAALLASLGVTAAYHLGYPEFRGRDLAEPLFGNGIMTVGYLVFANPVTALVAHVALHVASVIHGVDATATLPRHS